LGELGDLLHQVNRAHHQPYLSVLIFLAAVVMYANEAIQLDVLFRRVGDGDVVGGPGNPLVK